MKPLICLMMVIFNAAAAAAQGNLPVPWNELKQMMRQNIEAELVEKRPAPQAMVFSLNRGQYHLTLRRHGASGRMTLTGVAIAGDLAPIPLLDRSPAIEAIQQSAGGHLLSDGGGLSFLPEGHGPFEIKLAFALPLAENGGELAVDLPVAPALQNRIAIDPSDGLVLTLPPGIESSDGSFLFSADRRLRIRFAETAPDSRETDPEVATLSLISAKGKQMVLNTLLWPLTPLTTPIEVSVPEGFTLAASSMGRAVSLSESGRSLRIQWPQHADRPQALEFRAPLKPAGDRIRFVLPRITGNLANEGLVWLEQPENGQIRLAPANAPAAVSTTTLPPEMQPVIPAGRQPLLVDPEQAVDVRLRRFEAAETPPTVLSDLAFYVAFEENGHILSVLQMTVPPGTGDHLTMAAPQQAQIWSLTVNGRSRQVFKTPEGQWVLPISPDTTSQVELVFLRKGQKVGLQGRLEARLPETGLPCAMVTVGIALPKRVELLSLDGPVSPAESAPERVPRDFIGRPHFFERAFYKGEPLTLEIAYREPAGVRTTVAGKP
jgi:hypothetical protein